jgi:hypothetical protein
MLKIESARNGKSWDDIENADNDQVSVTTSVCRKQIYTHPFMPSHHNLFCSYQDMDLLKGYISKVQQLESELMRQNFSNACRHGLNDQLAMEQDILLNELGSGCEIGTPDASSKPLSHFLKSFIVRSSFLSNSRPFSELFEYAYNMFLLFFHMMINLDFASEVEPLLGNIGCAVACY